MKKRELVLFCVFVVFGIFLISNLTVAQSNDTDNNSTNITNATECTVNSDCYPAGTQIPSCGLIRECSGGQCINVSLECPPSNDTDDNGEVDDDTKKEAKDMESNHGAIMRLLQLKRGIMVRVLWAEIVVEHLDAKAGVPDETITQLNGVIEELRLLIKEIDELIENPLNKEEMVDRFLHIKKEAKGLMKEFRELAGQYLDGNEKGQLRSRFNEVKRAELDSIRDQILQERRELNAERAEKILEHMGIDDDELLESIKNGELTEEEIGRKLREYYNNLTPEQRQTLKQKIRGEMDDRINKVNDRTMAHKANWYTKSSERLQERADELQEAGQTGASTILSNRAAKITERRDMMRNRLSS